MILRDGLAVSHADTIRYWIASSARCLGGARVVEIVRERLERDPETASRALYWLWPYASDNGAVGASLRAMQREINVRLPHRARPVDPD
jgi:hypothetical protein